MAKWMNTDAVVLLALTILGLMVFVRCWMDEQDRLYWKRQLNLNEEATSMCNLSFGKDHGSLGLIDVVNNTTNNVVGTVTTEMGIGRGRCYHGQLNIERATPVKGCKLFIVIICEADDYITQQDCLNAMIEALEKK